MACLRTVHTIVGSWAGRRNWHLPEMKTRDQNGRAVLRNVLVRSKQEIKTLLLGLHGSQRQICELCMLWSSAGAYAQPTAKGVPRAIMLRLHSTKSCLSQVAGISC
jgi:hypothetical protein